MLNRASLFSKCEGFHYLQQAEKAGVTYLFPGQGSMAPGVMKDLFLHDDHFQDFVTRTEVFTKNKSLPSIIDYISQNKISPRDFFLVQNLALLCCEAALFNKFKENLVPSILYGHSLGEYSVLVCSGYLTFEEGLELIYLRELSCPSDSPGSMTALNCRNKDISSVLTLREVSVANRNSPDQIILSHSKEVTEEIYAQLRKKRIPFVPLHNIKYPYHSELMSDSAKILLGKIESTFRNSGRQLDFPFFSSVTNKEYKTVEEVNNDFFEIVSEQLTSQVDFISFISSLISHQQLSFVECGPGNALQGFVRSISKQKLGERKHFYFYKLNFELKKKVNSSKIINSKWFTLLNKVIGDITGYELGDIQFDKRFQEDLGIDSIKKAEILYKVFMLDGKIDPRNISLSQFRSIDEFVSFMENKKNFLGQDQESLFPLNPEFEIYHFCPREVSATLEPVKSYPLKSFKSIKNGSFLNLIEESYQFDFLAMKKVLQASIWDNIKLVNILLDKNTHHSNGLASFLKSYFKEKRCKPVFHYVSKASDLVSCKEVSGDYLYDNGKIFSLIPAEYKPTENLSTPSKKRILFIAGHTGIGKYLLKHSSLFPGNEVVVIGRSVENQTIGNVHYVKGDITDLSFLNTFFQEEASFDICINAAGIQLSKSFDKTTLDDFMKVKSIKLDAVTTLVKFLKSHDCKFFVNFSSIVSFFGNEGQYAYAYANEVMRHINKNIDGMRTLTINWPAWDQVGMTEDLGIYQRLSESGISFLPPSEAVHFFDSLMKDSSLVNRDVFIIDKKDIYLFGYKLKNREESLLKLIDPRSLSFAQSLSIVKNKELKDHHLNGLEILPSSLVVADLISIFKDIYYYKDVIEFNFTIKNMSLFKDGLLDILFKGSRKSQVLEYEVLSNGVSIFQVNELKGPPSFSMSKEFSLSESKAVDISSYYRKEVVNFGPSFKVLEKVYFNEKNQSLIICIEHKDTTSIIESVFQSLSLLGLILGGGVALPVSVESFIFHSDTFFKELKIKAEIESMGAKEIVGNVRVVNEKGETFLTVQGLKMSFINKYEKSPITVVRS